MHKHRKNPMMAAASPTGRAGPVRKTWAALLVLAGVASNAPVLAQNFPITPGQRATAQQVAQSGVPLADLAANAPDQYTVKRGDTLWDISALFLTRPWRWPELWGMNIEQVRNPHRIYPGQVLVLEKKDGRATLRLQQADAAAGGNANMPTDTVRVSPRTRIALLPDSAIPTLRTHLIEPFLAEPVIVDELALQRAPRIVAASESRVLITRGDRAYARGVTPLTQRVAGRGDDYRVFRDAQPLRDPVTRAVLGYEAQFLGKATLVRSETSQMVRNAKGEEERMVVPATIDIMAAKEEMRVGDRLLPEPPREFASYVPHAPAGPMEGTIVSVYGNSVSVAGQNQVVVINRGTADGIETGHVLAILKDGERRIDRTQAGEQTPIKLPDERNGLLMVFRPFEKLSYALILEIGDTVKIGDRVSNPR